MRAPALIFPGVGFILHKLPSVVGSKTGHYTVSCVADGGGCSGPGAHLPTNGVIARAIALVTYFGENPRVIVIEPREKNGLLFGLTPFVAAIERLGLVVV